MTMFEILFETANKGALPYLRQADWHLEGKLSLSFLSDLQIHAQILSLHSG